VSLIIFALIVILAINTVFLIRAIASEPFSGYDFVVRATRSGCR